LRPFVWGLDETSNFDSCDGRAADCHDRPRTGISAGRKRSSNVACAGHWIWNRGKGRSQWYCSLAEHIGWFQQFGKRAVRRFKRERDAWHSDTSRRRAILSTYADRLAMVDEHGLLLAFYDLLLHRKRRYRSIHLG